MANDKAYKQRWYLRNRKHLIKKALAYHKKHRRHLNLLKRGWRKKNKSKINKYLSANRPRILKRKKSYYQRHRKEIIRKQLLRYYRNKPKKIKSKRISVTAFTIDGKKVKTFKSIHMFLQYVGGGRMTIHDLRRIRDGKLLCKNGYLFGMATKFYGCMSINPFRCDSLLKKSNADKKRNLLRIAKLYRDNQFIAIIDNKLRLIGYTRQDIKSLAIQENVPVGTIKASLHRSAKKFMHSLFDTRHYVHLKDLPVFISNAKKSL